MAEYYTSPDGTKQVRNLQTKSGYYSGPVSNVPFEPPTVSTATLTPTKPYTLPTQPKDTNNYLADIASGTAQITAGMGSTDVAEPEKTDFQKMISALAGPINQTDLRTSIYGQTPQEIAMEQQTAAQEARSRRAALRAAQSELAGIQAQVQGIVDQAKAQNLTLEKNASGGLITTDFLSRQQQEVNRQSAIAALPLQSLALATQAKVAGLQGEVEYAQSTLKAAQDKLDKVFTLMSQDQENKVNFYNKNVELIYNELSKREKDRVDERKAALATNQSNLADARNFAQTLSTTALSNGQADIAAGLAQIPQPDVNSKTFSADLQAYNGKIAALQGKIVDKNAGLDTQLKQLQIAKARQDLAGINNAIDSGQPIVAPADPTKTTAQNNVQTLRQVFQSSKVSAGNKTSVGNALALTQAAQDLADANIDGKFSGFSPFRAVTDFKIPFTNIGLPFREALKRNETIQNEAMISALNLQTQFWASGAALTEAQTELVQKMIPVVTDTDTQIRTKVNQLINYMLSQTAARLVTDGIDFKPAKVDMFETVGLLDKASPEQLAELKAAGLTQ